MSTFGTYGKILLRAHEIQALVEDRKYGQALRCAEDLREQLGRFCDAEYAEIYDIRDYADPIKLAECVVAAGERAHPLTMELELNNLCSLLDRIMGDAQEAKREQAQSEQEPDAS